jgi:conjugative transfer relaxase protein TraI
MMSFSQVKSAGTAGGYYTAKDNYYVLGSMDEQWFGKGAQQLGLDGPVDKATFTQVLQGKLPDGSDLSRMQDGVNKHRAGYDFTFSAPKSVSMMVLMGGDMRLLDAHNRAVTVALNELEKMASTRVMTEGVSRTELTGNLVIARFNHDTSRAQEPQLHTHAVTANATFHDGKWQTLATDTVGKTGFVENVLAVQTALGRLYREALRADVEHMGYRTEETGNKHGMWEMKDVPVAAFSTRHREIHAAVGEDASPKARDVAALDTRQAKKVLDPVEKLAEWHAVLKETGFDIGDYRAQADARVVEGRAPAPVSPDAPDVDKAVGEAIALLSERSVQFSYAQTLARTLHLLPAQPGMVQQAREGIARAIETQQLIPLDREKGVFTSTLHVMDELSVAALGREILDRGQAVVLPARGPERTAPYSDAVSVLAQDRAPLAVLSGRGGAGVQRDRIVELVTMSREQGREVQVLAADNRSLRYLQADARLGEVTLTGKSTLQPAEGGPPAPAGLALTPNSTLIVDQGEKLTLKEAEALLVGAARHNVQVLVMDTQARQGTGNVLRVLTEAGVNPYRYQGGKQADVHLVSEPDKQARMAGLADSFAQALQAGEAVTAQVSGAREQASLTRDIRQALHQAGVLRGPEVTVTALTPVWMSAGEKKSTDSWRPGMVLEQWDADTHSRTRWQVDRVNPETRTLVLNGADGQRETVRLGALNSAWSAYRPAQLQVAEGDRLQVLARIPEARLNAGERVTVTGVSDGGLEVAGVRGGVIALAGTDSVFTAPKLAPGYVEGPGASVSDGARVFVSLTAREMNQATLNQVARSGSQVMLFTPLPAERAQAKLARTPVFSRITTAVKDLAGEPEISAAMAVQRDRLHTPAQQALHLAVPVLENQSIGLHHAALVAEATGMAPAGERLSVAAVNQEIGAMVRRGELITVDVADGHGTNLLVSRASFEAEKSILQHVLEGKDAVPPLMNRVPAGAVDGLTGGQRVATDMILATRDRFTLVQGYAGVGKTTQFRAVMGALETLPEAARPQVVGLGPTHRAVGEMQGAGVPAQTLSSFLHDTQESLRTGETPDFSRTLFLMDESSMTGNTDMATAYALIAAGGGRSVSVGDSDQLQPIAAGAPFRLQQQRSAIDMAVMKDIVRQVPALRPAVYNLINRDVQGALAVMETVHPTQVPRRAGAWVPDSSVLALGTAEVTGEGEKSASATPHTGSGEKVAAGTPDSPLSAIVADWMGRTDGARAQTLIITHLNEDRRAVNAALHAHRREAKELQGPELELPVLTPGNIPDGALRSLKTWGANRTAVVRLDERYWAIAEVDREAGLVTLHGRDGEARLLSPAEAVREKATLYHPETIAVSAGDRMRFSRTDNERGYVANQVATVTAVREGGRLVLDTGKRQVVVDPLGDEAQRHVDLAYAITTHGAQGASEVFEIALEGVEGARSRMTSLESAYVALSRARQHVQVYTDNREAWAEKAGESAKRATAHDILAPRNDRDMRTAARLMQTAKPLQAVAQGRAILRATGIRGETRGKFIGGGKTFPQPHVAFPAFDRNGKAAGLWLSPVRADNVPSPAGRIKGSPEAQFIALQQSRDGQTLLAEGVQDGLVKAAHAPDTGVVVRLHGEGQPWNPGSITGGKVWVGAGNVQRPADNPEGTVPFPVAAEEKRLRALAVAAEKVAREQTQKVRQTPDGAPDNDARIRALIRDKVNGLDGQAIPDRALLVGADAARIRDEAVRTVAEANNPPATRERLQQTEQDILRDRTRDLTPGGD